jgi:hypothetical protein
MSKPAANYPASQWDGSSASRTSDPSVDRAPFFQDYDQLVEELKATQAELDKSKFLSLPNGAGADLVVGTPVYALANGTGAAKADCNGSVPARDVLGLVSTGDLSVGHNGTVVVQLEGEITLTTAQWDAVAGTSGGLAANKAYYLSGPAGDLVLTRPATTGDNIITMIIAISATKAKIIRMHNGIA